MKKVLGYLKPYIPLVILAVAFLVADTTIDFVLLVEVEGVPQPSAGTLAIDELTRRGKELPKMVE